MGICASVSATLRTEWVLRLEEEFGMACWIESHCNACGLCIAACPVWAIREEAQQVWIEPQLCTECLGYASQPSCAFICPMDAIGGEKTQGDIVPEPVAQEAATRKY